MAGRVQVLSYSLLNNLDSIEKVNKILAIAKKGDVVMIEGRMTANEETFLISQAMANVSGKFSGVEVAFLDSQKSLSFLEKIKKSLIQALAKDRMGITVIGPSKIIKEIKMNPNKLEILFK